MSTPFNVRAWASQAEGEEYVKPVVWRIFRNNRWNYSDKPDSGFENKAAWQPLYTARQDWVGLTDAEIADLWKDKTYVDDFARAIEAKLREKNL